MIVLAILLVPAAIVAGLWLIVRALGEPRFDDEGP
jgi:hypothetical protein